MHIYIWSLTFRTSSLSCGSVVLLLSSNKLNMKIYPIFSPKRDSRFPLTEASNKRKLTS